MIRASTQMPFSCETDLVSCDTAASGGAIRIALENGDVQQALAESPILYGWDRRGNDKPVFQVDVGSAVIQVGDPCDEPTNCKPIPAGVQALVDVLNAMDAELSLTPACEAFK